MAPAAKTPKQRKAAKKVCKKVKVKGTRRTKTVCRPKPKKKVAAKKPVLLPVAAPAGLRPHAPAGHRRRHGARPDRGRAARHDAGLPRPGATRAATAGHPRRAGLHHAVRRPPGHSACSGARASARSPARPRRSPSSASSRPCAASRDPSGAATLVGAEPTVDGVPIAPYDAWGHDHLWWLDRMVRSDQPLVERMTLIWHDWLATSNADVNSRPLMRAQNELFRSHALGSFAELITDVTIDPAMLLFLSGIDNHRWAPNENYARELMELFTLGADRGAYTEADVRSLARALTGWRADWDDAVGFVNFRFDPNRHDSTSKTLWAGTAYEERGAFKLARRLQARPRQPVSPLALRVEAVVVLHPQPARRSTQAGLEALYDSSGYSIRPVVEAILMHPDLYQGAPLVKPPVVYMAGLLRATGQTITHDAWVWLAPLAGQMLFYPPNVSGWNDRAWLDTSSVYGRWWIAAYALYPSLPAVRLVGGLDRDPHAGAGGRDRRRRQSAPHPRDVCRAARVRPAAGPCRGERRRIPVPAPERAAPPHRLLPRRTALVTR